MLLLFGGVLAGRLPRFRLMVTSDVVVFAGQAAIAALVLTARTSLVALSLLNMLTGAAGALFQPAARGAVQQIVSRADLQAANSLLRLSQNTTSVAGIALGGLLVATVGGGWGLAVDAGPFLVSAALQFAVRVADATRATRTTVPADLRSGWHEFISLRWVVTVGAFAARPVRRVHALAAAPEVAPEAMLAAAPDGAQPVAL